MMIRAGSLICPVLIGRISRLGKRWSRDATHIPVVNLVQVAAADLYHSVATDKRDAALNIAGWRARRPENSSDSAAREAKLRRAAIFDLDVMHA